MHDEFAPDFLSEDLLQSGVPEEEEVDEAEVEAEEEEEAADLADIEEEMI